MGVSQNLPLQFKRAFTLSVAVIAATDILLQKFAYQGLFIGVVLINYSVTMSNPLFGWSLDVVAKRFFCCLSAPLYIGCTKSRPIGTTFD